MKVYVVTSGHYSDYSIERVFLDKDKANKFVKYRNGYDSWKDFKIEEYDSFDDKYEVAEAGSLWRKATIKIVIIKNIKGVYSNQLLEYTNLIANYEVFKEEENKPEYYLCKQPSKNNIWDLFVYKWFCLTDKDDECEESEARMKTEDTAENLVTQVCDLLGQGYNTDQINKLGLRGE